LTANDTASLNTSRLTWNFTRTPCHANGAGGQYCHPDPGTGSPGVRSWNSPVARAHGVVVELMMRKRELIFLTPVGSVDNVSSARSQRRTTAVEVVGRAWRARPWAADCRECAAPASTILRRLSTWHSEGDRLLSTGCAHLVQSGNCCRFVQAPERGWTGYPLKARLRACCSAGSA